MNGKSLKNRLKFLGYELAEVARTLGVTPQNLQSKLNAEDLKLSFVIDVAKSINKSVYDLIGEPYDKSAQTTSILNEPEPTTKRPQNQNLLGLPKIVTVNEDDEELVPLVNVKAAAGYLNGYADPEYIEKLPTIRMPGLKGGTHRAFENSGHSMNPTFHNKSILIGRWVENFDEIRDRYVYIVVTKTDGVVNKRVLNRIKERNQLVLISDNANKREYPNIIVDAEDILELWKVRAAFSFEFPEPTQWQDRFNELEAQITYLAQQVKTNTHAIARKNSKD